MKFHGLLKPTIVLPLITATLWACGPKELSIVPGENCPIAEDQKSSFMAPVDDIRIEIQLDNRFTVTEKEAIKNTVQKWNTAAESLGRIHFFNLNLTTIPDSIRAADPHNCTTKIGDSSRFYIVRETNPTKWKDLGFSESIPGATVRCTNGAELVQQIIFLNPRLVEPEQFGTVSLHELGHSLGLDHSCLEGIGRQDYAGCEKLTENHPYRVAVMYPSITRASSSSTAETRDSLRRNDAQRTQCLYKKQ